MRIKEFVFVDDAFGDFPIRTLQHPTKEAKDAYLFLYSKTKRLPELPEVKKSAKISLDFLLKIDRLKLVGDIYITGEMKYKYVKQFDSNIITELTIEEITLFPDEFYDCSVKND